MVTIVDCSGPQDARGACARGDAVVITGTDAVAVGTLLRSRRGAGARVAAFVGDPNRPEDRSALDEMIAELFG